MASCKVGPSHNIPCKFGHAPRGVRAPARGPSEAQSPAAALSPVISQVSAVHPARGLHT